MVGKHLLEDVTGASCGDGGAAGGPVVHTGRSNGSAVPAEAPRGARPEMLGTPGYGAEDALSRP
jgi:amidophosphoribosyltransferase